MMVNDDKKQNLLTQIHRAAKQMSLDISPEQADKLIEYVCLLFKWNKAYNLTAIRNIDEMLHRHIVDSLSIVKLIQGDKFIDVGTGGGLPGIVLSIMFPEKLFVLLDSNGKKTRFLFQVKAELSLANVDIKNLRVEQFSPNEKFDGVISRAFSSLAQMYQWTKHLVAKNGRFFAMKGVYNQAEIDELPNGLMCTSHDLFVPNEEGQRHLLVIEHTEK